MGLVSPYQSCDRGREDQDGQCRHIIGLGLLSHLPVDYSCNRQGLRNIYTLDISISCSVSDPVGSAFNLGLDPGSIFGIRILDPDV